MIETMAGCPNPPCHEKFKLELADRPTSEEFAALEKCVKQKVSIKSVRWWAGTLIAAFIALAILVVPPAITLLTGQEIDEHKYAKKEDLADCRERTAGIEATVNYLHHHLAEIKANQGKIEADIKTNQNKVESYLENIRNSILRLHEPKNGP